MRTVAVAGKFDPPHDGHIKHIEAAGRLGDYLYIIIHPDEVIQRGKNGKLNIPQWAREVLLRGVLRHYGIAGNVVISIDGDGLVSKTLRVLRPSIFAKGGPYSPRNLPESEVEVCNEIGCEVVYGIGGYSKDNNSSQMVVGEDSD